MMRPCHPVPSVAQEPPRRRPLPRMLPGSALVMLALAMAGANVAHAQGKNPIARFDGGVGVQLALVGGAPNTVNPCPAGSDPLVCENTNPAGRPWVISDLKAEVFGDGAFDIRGKGLIFAGGANVGRSGGVNVRARLYCGTGADARSFTSTAADAVALAPNGDFRLAAKFPVVNLPLECPNATLLVLNGNATGWFAAGIPKD